MTTKAIRFASLLSLVFVTISARAQTQPPDDEASRYFQTLGHYIVEDRKVQNELTETPCPFLDWGLVQPGIPSAIARAHPCF